MMTGKCFVIFREGYGGYEINTFNGISHGVWSDEERVLSLPLGEN